MSHFLSIATDIKTRLDTALNADANGITVIVDRQKDILTEVNKAVGKAKGVCISILFTGYTRRNGRKFASYAIRIWSKPIVQGEDNLADDLLELADAALHEFIPPSMSPQQDNCHFQLTVEESDLVPDKNFLCYEIAVTAPVK